MTTPFFTTDNPNSIFRRLSLLKAIQNYINQFLTPCSYAISAQFACTSMSRNPEPQLHQSPINGGEKNLDKVDNNSNIYPYQKSIH